jgi:hypothetical protein
VKAGAFWGDRVKRPLTANGFWVDNAGVRPRGYSIFSRYEILRSHTVCINAEEVEKARQVFPEPAYGPDQGLTQPGAPRFDASLH